MLTKSTAPFSVRLSGLSQVEGSNTKCAFLVHLHQPATSHLELYVRQTATTFSVMHDNGFTLPSEYPVDHAMLPKDFLPEQQFEPSVAPGGAPAKPANGGASKEKKEGDVSVFTRSLSSL